MAEWLTAAAVLAWADQLGSISDTDAALVGSVNAAAAWIEGTGRPDLPWSEWTAEQVPADIRLGGLMLAWRWYQRHASPLGVAGYQEFGTAPLLRHDPDIARLLGIGAEGTVVFGAAGVRRDSLTATDTTTGGVA